MTDGAISRSAWRRWLGTYRSLSFIPHLVIPIPLLWAKTSRPIKITTSFMDSSRLSINKKKKSLKFWEKTRQMFTVDQMEDRKRIGACVSNETWETCGAAMQFFWDDDDDVKSGGCRIGRWHSCPLTWTSTSLPFHLLLFFLGLLSPPRENLADK